MMKGDLAIPKKSQPKKKKENWEDQEEKESVERTSKG